MADSAVTVAIVGAGGAIATALITAGGAVLVRRRRAPETDDATLTVPDLNVARMVQAIVRESDAKDHVIDMWRTRALRCEAQREEDQHG